ncbi:MAG TPA: disulfide bond formation protein B [Candidatus Paceibacterota bacterium]
MSVDFINWALSLKIIALQAITAVLVVVFFFREREIFKTCAHYVGRWGLWIGCVVSLGASLTTLYYSEVLGFTPCVLCWWQRIFLYPQVFLLGFAAHRKDAGMAFYSIVLSGLGLLVALYHHALQMGWVVTAPCAAEGTVSCAQRLLFEFGYITYPLMAASVFLFLIVLMLFVRAFPRLAADF